MLFLVRAFILKFSSSFFLKKKSLSSCFIANLLLKVGPSVFMRVPISFMLWNKILISSCWSIIWWKTTHANKILSGGYIWVSSKISRKCWYVYWVNLYRVIKYQFRGNFLFIIRCCAYLASRSNSACAWWQALELCLSNKIGINDKSYTSRRSVN